MKKNGCTAVFMAAEQAFKLNQELNIQNVRKVCDRAIQFIENRESDGDKLDVQKVADSLVRLMPCLKMVSYF